MTYTVKNAKIFFVIHKKNVLIFKVDARGKTKANANNG